MDTLERECDIYRIKKTRSIYDQRRQWTQQIPKFWYIVLAQNDDFVEYLGTDDLKYLEALQDIYVEWLVKPDGSKSDSPRDFLIHFKFDSFDDSTELQQVVKYFENVEKNGEETLESRSASITWPKEYDEINPAKIGDKTSKEGKHLYRTGMKSFFAWFKWTGIKPGKEFRQGEELLRLISDDIFPYAVKYYTEAMTSIADDDEEESSEELDLSDDDDEEEEVEEVEEKEESVKRQKI